MRILITGAGGQLGRDLHRALPEHDLRPLTHADLDTTDPLAVDTALQEFRPTTVIHAAALTDTTRCEREPGLAHAHNAQAARNVAAACVRARASMVLMSTNEVFDGTKASPYLESDAASPVNAYGRSKLAGERLVQAVLPRAFIVRTAWLYGRGGNHFVAKMLSAAGQGHLSGVTDEIASPTWTHDLAAAIAQLIQTQQYGLYHLTNAGQASRYGWVREILRLAGKTDVAVQPQTTTEFRASLASGVVVPTKPPYSVLANTRAAALGIELPPWQEALAGYFAAS